jgi:hypothetical protein
MCARVALALLLTVLTLRPAAAFEPILFKESAGADANLGTPCTLAGNTNGNSANLRWYNVCSGYIWIYCGFRQFLPHNFRKFLPVDAFV